jgi:hypothetical protein
MIINLRKRYELAVAKVVGESFQSDQEDVAWWVGLDEIDFGECENCGEPIIKPSARVHLDILDRNAGRLAQITGYFPTLLSPAEIRDATRNLIDGWRISSLEDDLDQAHHDHQHIEPGD